jgi:hypothetical protein
MTEQHSIGLAAGLILVTLLLFMLVGPQGVSQLMQAPQASYELTGSSTPAN